MSEESRRPSKVERNRDLASPPDTLHATRETWNDFERRVSGFALPLEPYPLPLDAARVTRAKEGGRKLLHNTWKYYLTFQVIALRAY